MSTRACPSTAGHIGGREVVPSNQHLQRRNATSPLKSLYETCCNVIVSNLERYSPDSFVACYEDDWDHILRLRHRKTKPQTGSGGLDGTGRMAPAISDKLMTRIEKDNPHLAESKVADELVWRDCVEYRFRRGGLTRPKALNWPWPNLVALVNESVSIFKHGSMVEQLETVGTLLDLPMSVSLLQATGAGKIVKKALKAHSKTKSSPEKHQSRPHQEQQHELLGQKLKVLLDAWKALATDDAPQTQKSTLPSSGNAKNPQDDDTQEALALAKACSNWRQLFAALKGREDNRRSSQGKRMREIRKNLASGRPKVVKVRPATAKQQRVSAAPNERAAMMSHSSSSNNTKLSKIRREAAALSSHRHVVRSHPTGSLPSSSSMTTSNKRKASSFGDAVAFVSGVKKQKTAFSSRKKTTIQRMEGGKVMNVPVGRSAGIARKPPPPPSSKLLREQLRKT